MIEMADANTLKPSENGIFNGTQNDVVTLHQSTMVTEATSDGNHINANIDVLDNCGVAGVSALTLNELPTTMVDNDCNIFNIGKNKGKRRRRKTKSKSNSKPYKKSNWKFQMPRSRLRGDEVCLSTLVPYNTNKFLMEEHMPQLNSGRMTPSGRTRDSSFSVDSEDNNYFHALSEDEEDFLTKEFSSVYEDARSERLDGMSKNQLIREYLQLEANYDKLSKNLGARKSVDDNAKEVQIAKNFESQHIIETLEEKVRELSAENLDLRRQMADIRNRSRRSRSRSSRRPSKTSPNSSSCSADSESDSTGSDTGSNSSRSRHSIRSSRSSSKSSLSDIEKNCVKN